MPSKPAPTIKKSPDQKLRKLSMRKPTSSANRTPQKSAVSGKLSCVRTSAARTSSASSGDRGSHSLRATVTPRRKVTHHLDYDKVANIIAATKHACHIGLPFNRFITISWEKGHVPDHTPATSKFLAQACAAMRTKGCRTAYVWSQEWGPVVGQHVHILIHVPPDLATWFAKLQRGWLKRCGVERGRNVIKTKRIGHSYAAAFSTGPLATVYQLNLWNLVNYILKDAEPKALGLLEQPATLGGSPVHGKRSATSENIGVSARAKLTSSARASEL